MMYITVTDQDTAATFTFQNTNAAGGLISNVEGFMYPSVNFSIEDIAGNQSALGVMSKFGQRLMTFSYNITCDVLETRRDILAALRQSRTLKLVEFETVDALELRAEAYVTKVSSLYRDSKTNTLYFEFRAPDWRFYGQTLLDETYLVNTTSEVTNAGNEVAPAVFTITGPGNALTVNNLTTGQSFSIGNLTGGEVVVVDSKNRTVTLDGDPAMSILTGDFFDLEPGANELQFTASSGSSGATELVVAWRNAYNGV